MNYCWKKGCYNLICWRDITEEWAFCNSHAESSGPEVQLNLRHVSTGEPYLEPDDPDDLVDYDNPSLVGPQHWPPPVKKVEEKIILSAEDIGEKKVGDNLFCQAGAPGVGHVMYKITRIDENWVHGYEIENTVRVLDPDEVI